MGLTYKDAGVDVEAGYKAVKLMKEHVAKTFNKNVIGNIGSFGGLFSLDIGNMKEPVLVAGTDGVGTKLQLAFLTNKHDTIGRDCVAMCVNDIVCQGAKPLFFLDYIASGKMEPEKVAQIVKGISDGCIESGCALIGGETAEMPGFYKDDEYDIAGFAVGVVDRSKIIDGTTISEGDIIIGIESSGIHSNGYSLVRKLMVERNSILHDFNEDLGCSIGEELLKPTRIYVNGISNLLQEVKVKGISHITGGGFYENIPRMFSKNLTAEIDMDTWPIKPVFHLIQRLGDIDDKNMFNTFNMGIGMVVVCSKNDVSLAMDILNKGGYPSHVIGKIRVGSEGVVLNR